MFVRVTILILIDGFLQLDKIKVETIDYVVTILILIDGFLQYLVFTNNRRQSSSHNPYFNRWFSAIVEKKEGKKTYNCHNPYFNRWFSAIGLSGTNKGRTKSHNPYFNRWFSAIRLLFV